MTGTVIFMILMSTIAVFAIWKLRNGTMLKILGKLTDMLEEKRNISEVHKFLMKKIQNFERNRIGYIRCEKRCSHRSQSGDCVYRE